MYYVLLLGSRMGLFFSKHTEDCRVKGILNILYESLCYMEPWYFPEPVKGILRQPVALEDCLKKSKAISVPETGIVFEGLRSEHGMEVGKFLG